MTMQKEELLDRYEATGDEGTYREAKRLYEEALAETADDARLLFEYGYLQECRGRFSIRAAVSCYERAIVADPEWAKARHQFIWASAALSETSKAIELYKVRLARAPEDPREYAYLAHAFVLAQQYDEAERVVEAGLEISPEHVHLLDRQGDICAATGRTEDALAHWKHVYELDPELIDPHYSAAFLLERENRLAEAADEWRFIINWLEKRDYAVQADWPKRELKRLRKRLETSG
jgi:tetratricopeptide (TPR) repeat protein